MKLSRWLVLPDLHDPYIDKRAFNAVLWHAEKHHWRGIVQLGDWMDCFLISRFAEGKPGLTKDRDVQDDFDSMEISLGRVLDASRKKTKNAEVVWIEGNHEHRMNTYTERDPKWKKTLHIPTRFKLEERGVQWVRHWSLGQFFRVGHASFIHGLTAVQHHASKTVRDFGSNVFYGHTHDVQEFPVRRIAKSATIKGKSLGCLCDFEQSYMRGRPVNWQHAFGIFHFWPDGTFQETTVHIHKGRFVSPLDGKVYQG